MKLNIADWKEFRIDKIFDIYTGGDLIMGDIEEGDIPIASNSTENNNIATYTNIIPNRKLFDHTKSISIADRGKFWAFIQPKDFYLATRVKGLVCKDDNVLNRYQMAFIVSIINQESFKFSYGRNCCANLPNIELKLPVKLNSKKTPFIDATYRYSDDGYMPDWEFMENYIKSLHHKPLATKNRVGLTPNLNIEKWREFKVGDLFTIKRGDRIVHNEDYFDEQNDEYKYPVITTTTMNNGVDGFYNDTNCDGNCIVSAGEASGLFSTYQENPFWALDTVRIYTPIGFSMNKYIGMFLVTLLTYNMYRFSYGRKAKPDNMYSLDIKLPITENGDPDWAFMENYIKSLPYGDRLDG